MQEFMRASGLANLTVSQRVHAYALLAELLVDYAEEIADYSGTPISGNLLANLCPKIAAIFDRAFPGYTACGLAPMVAGKHRIRVSAR